MKKNPGIREVAKQPNTRKNKKESTGGCPRHPVAGIGIAFSALSGNNRQTTLLTEYQRRIVKSSLYKAGLMAGPWRRCLPGG
ncbi:MAG: hypothetical protein ACOY40_14330 [Bacillota bacterium]